MAKKSDRFPPLTVVSGGQSFLRRRFLSNLMRTQQKAGWKVVEVDAAVAGSVQNAVEGDPFNPELTLAVVVNPEKAPLEFLEAHAASKDYQTTLVLHVEGEPDGRSKLGKAIKAQWEGVHKSFPEPSDWQAPKVAVDFVQSELQQRFSLKIPLPLATVLVERVGSDLGVLSFEVEKIATLARLGGAQEVEVLHIKGAMAPIAEASAFPIVDALQARNKKKLAKALWTLRKTSKDDPTMRVGRLVASSVVKWMQASQLSELPAKAAAEELKIHPWVYETKILPAVKVWGFEGAVRILSDLAATERAVLTGAQDPWVVLSTRLLSACG